MTRLGLPMTCLAVSLMAGQVGLATQQRSPESGAQGFRFRTGVELINVTATVVDGRGRFVSGLTLDDFLVFEDDELQEVTHFSSERVPVSLGIALDTSGSMAGAKIGAAHDALDRFLYDLLDPLDEIFLWEFNEDPYLLHDWTTDRAALSRAIGRVRPGGGTAMYDAVAQAVPMAQTGRHQKRALVIISDGNDTNSRTGTRALQQLIRETEVLVYAIGIDGRGRPGGIMTLPRLPLPFPFPGTGRRGPTSWPRGGGATSDERVNVSALRDLTDDSGGRTEIVRTAADLDPATAGVADELSQQYYLGYPSRGLKDGRWHSIRVEVRDSNYRVRARRGYVATP